MNLLDRISWGSEDWVYDRDARDDFASASIQLEEHPKVVCRVRWFLEYFRPILGEQRLMDVRSCCFGFR